MRIADVSPAANNFLGSLSRVEQSISGKGLCVAIAADGQRAYLGGHSGVWRSDDGGDTWWHPEWRPTGLGGPTQPGALPLTNVYDLASGDWSQPFRPPSTAPVVSTYSSIRPGRNENPVIQSISWFGPATNPSSDIVKCQSTFPPAACGSVALIRHLLRSACGLQSVGPR
jgi:hypothetical protein